jgi:uncharacterized protein YcbK (DUF882 family)
MGDLSEHLSLSEFKCHDNCGLPTSVEPQLIYGLESLRHAAGDVPIMIDCGGRCVAHNNVVGGAAKSEHIVTPQQPVCWASDIRISGLTVLQMYTLADKVPVFNAGGVGLYPEGFIHVDARKWRARWCRIDGVYRPIEEFPGFTSPVSS